VRAQRNLAAGQKCPYCKREMRARPDPEAEHDDRVATIEHVVTQGRGGGNQPYNMIWACKRCNNLRGSVPYDVFVLFSRVVVRQYPDAPKAFLKKAMLEFVYALADAAMKRSDAVNHAVRMGLLCLAADMEKNR